MGTQIKFKLVSLHFESGVIQETGASTWGDGGMEA